MKAGFDTTVIPLDQWNDMLYSYGLRSAERVSDQGWIWRFKGKNVIVTSHEPKTGKHYSDLPWFNNEQDMLGYVGIEGDTDFVTKVFNDLKRNAEFVKDECFGRRDYI